MFGLGPSHKPTPLPATGHNVSGSSERVYLRIGPRIFAIWLSLTLDRNSSLRGLPQPDPSLMVLPAFGRIPRASQPRGFNETEPVGGLIRFQHNGVSSPTDKENDQTLSVAEDRPSFERAVRALRMDVGSNRLAGPASADSADMRPAYARRKLNRPEITFFQRLSWRNRGALRVDTLYLRAIRST